MVFIFFLLKSLIIYLTLIYIILVSSFCYLLQFSYLYDLKSLFYIKKFQKLKYFNSSFIWKLFYVALHCISIKNIEFYIEIGYFHLLQFSLSGHLKSLFYFKLFTLLFLFFTIIFHLYSKIKNYSNLHFYEFFHTYRGYM